MTLIANMHFMLTLLAFAAAHVSARTAAPPPVVSVEGTTVYADSANDVAVKYFELSTGKVYFLSKLPAGWSFSVDVDGDQNGAWGLGAGPPTTSMVRSPDYKFGQDSRNGVFCSQYILTHWEDDPSSIYASSECGGLKSNGNVSISGFDDRMRATIVFEIPSEEFFRDHASARFEVCVWDTKRTVCQHGLPELLELKRELPTAAAPKP